MTWTRTRITRVIHIVGPILGKENYRQRGERSEGLVVGWVGESVSLFEVGWGVCTDLSKALAPKTTARVHKTTVSPKGRKRGRGGGEGGERREGGGGEEGEREAIDK